MRDRGRGDRGGCRAFFRAVVRDEIADIVVFEGNRDGDGRHRPWGEWQYGGGIAWVLRAVYCGAQEHRHIVISSVLGRRARSVFACEPRGVCRGVQARRFALAHQFVARAGDGVCIGEFCDTEIDGKVFVGDVGVVFWVSIGIGDNAVAAGGALARVARGDHCGLCIGVLLFDGSARASAGGGRIRRRRWHKGVVGIVRRGAVFLYAERCLCDGGERGVARSGERRRRSHRCGRIGGRAQGVLFILHIGGFLRHLCHVTAGHIGEFYIARHGVLLFYVAHGQELFAWAIARHRISVAFVIYDLFRRRCNFGHCIVFARIDVFAQELPRCDVMRHHRHIGGLFESNMAV
mgnify:CR=1 FL=1